MQFPIPFIDVLTIPTGAGDGEARTIIDGTTGVIEVYDSFGDLFITIDPDSGITVLSSAASGGDNVTIIARDNGHAGVIRLSTGHEDESSPGAISVNTLAGTVWRMTVRSPRQVDDPTLFSAIYLDSEATPGSRDARIEFDTKSFGLDPDLVQSATGPVGNVVGKVEIFSAGTNTVLGYIPLYDGIT